jgi:hypothetical protein
LNDRQLTREEWNALGEKLFGVDRLKWRFRCPACRRAWSAEDFRPFKNEGATPDIATQECRGRWTGGREGPDRCDWSAFGLFAGPWFVTLPPEEAEKSFAVQRGLPGIPVFPFATELDT